MSERYYLTGAQIGMIAALLKKVTELNFRYLPKKDALEIAKILQGVEANQFVGNILKEGEQVVII